MNTTTLDRPRATDVAPPRSQANARSGLPLRRLITVELRKSVNTRAGRWLAGAILGGSAVVMAIMVIVGVVNDETYGLLDFMQVANFLPMGLLLPVLGILSVTGEWSQRTNMVTFTLEPRRHRVVVAKLATGVIFAVGAAVGATLIGLAALAVFDVSGGTATWELPGQALIAFTLVQLIGVLTGFAFGMLILNTPAAIVAFFAYSFLLPTVFLAGASLWDWAESIRPWLDLSFVQTPLTEGSLNLNWLQFAVTASIWFVAPVALGARRLLRAEIK
jgi:ABC-2 type transport system permease protein